MAVPQHPPPIVRWWPFVSTIACCGRPVDRLAAVNSTGARSMLRLVPTRTMRTAAQPSNDPAAAAAANRAASARVRRASRGSFAVCLGAAFALNLVAISVFAAVATRWQSTPASGTRTSWITATTIEPSVETDPTPDAPRRAPETKLPTDQPPADARERTPLPTQLAAPTPQAPTALPAEGEPMRFYGFGEVDRPAEPEPDSDWNLDPAALDVLGVQALVFDIYISRTGEVIDCEIVEPRSLPDDARLALQQRVRETVMQPAIRHDVAVASVRRIEISVAGPGP